MLRVPPWSPINQILAVEQFGSPRFLESPLVPLPCSRDPGHAPFALPSQQRGVAPACAKYEGRSDCNFGADSHSFSTRCLRFQLRISLHWQDSLPAGGMPLPGGIRTHWTPSANFKRGFTSRLFQRPRLRLAPLTPYFLLILGASSIPPTISPPVSLFLPKCLRCESQSPHIPVSRQWAAGPSECSAPPPC